MTTVKQVFDGAELPQPVYTHDAYVVLSRDDVVLAAGSPAYIKSLHTAYAGYYDDCRVEVRQHDLYMNDNAKVWPATNWPD